jgi:transposase
MFARIRKNSGTKRCSVVVCHNLRRGDKIRQVTVKTFGHSAKDAEIKSLLAQAKHWIKNFGAQWLHQNLSQRKANNMKHILLNNLREEARVNVGIEDVFGKLYDEIGFQTLLSAVHQKTLRKVLFARIFEPGSKRRLSYVAEKHLADELPLDRIYRMMDALMKKSIDVQQKVFAATQAVLNGKISLVLFDVTTLSFETLTEDELRAFGFSKDFKFNTTQVVLALATTQEGLPVGFKLFAGNTAETRTLIDSINTWRQYISIENVTVVGDRAMMSDANLTQLESANYDYIVAFPLRKLSKEQQKVILDRSKYKAVATDEEISRYYTLELGGRYLCASYSENRANKDQKDRERLVKKLRSKLESCKNAKRLVNTKGYLKYVEIAGNATASINEEKIAEDAKWDGLHAVISNKKPNGIEVYDKYRRLWAIEESFRINKHNLKMRPIYHFTPKRIQAHILLCYMEFTLLRHLQFKLRKANQPMSVDRIVDAIRDIQASILIDITDDRKYRMPSAITEDAQIIYKIFGLEHKLNIAPL